MRASVTRTRSALGRLSMRRERGQVLIVFATSILLFLLLCAAVVDMSWYWTNNLRMQRAADAAALAGVVFLPGDPATAITVARAEAAKNGYTNGSGGVTVTPAQDPSNLRRLNVTITGPIGTYFARTVGITSWPARRIATADYVLPVPMGSPDNYYGIGYLVKPVTTTTTSTSTSNGNSGFKVATTALGTPNWTATSGTLINSVNSNNNVYARTSTNNSAQLWGTFGLTSGLTAGQAITAVQGIQVRLSDAFVSATCANSKIQVALSWDNGVNWTTPPVELTGLTTSTTIHDITMGSASSTSAWAGHSWVPADLADNKFVVRTTAVKGCATAGLFVELDMLEVQVNYQITTTTVTSTTTLQPTAVTSPSGGALTPQNFWASMQSQGSISSQGDAFMTKYETRIAGGGTGTLNNTGGSDPDSRYDPNTYYNYIVEIPAGSSNGALWIFDPGFCDGSSSGGTGEYWHVNSSGTTNPSGYISRQPISAFYDLLNTNDTPFDLTDDTAVVSSGNTFKRLSYEDHVIFGVQGTSTNVADCSALSWHYGWYQLTTAPLLPGTYRLHTYSTDLVATSDQNNSTGLNAFAFYASATGGSPKIYGLGAMEAYVRLPGGTASEFYLAQIDAIHAGKTMVVNLWDPGDTGALGANVQILQPTTTGFTPATFKWKGTVGTTNTGASACGSLTGTNVTSVVTNTGGTSRFNGCWLTIEIALPTNYTAPSDPVTGQPGWWKIRYNMSGLATDLSTDLTTWKVDIRGNPVHLLIP